MRDYSKDLEGQRSATSVVNRIASTAHRSDVHRPKEIQLQDLASNIRRIEANIAKAARAGDNDKVTRLAALRSNQIAKAGLLADAISAATVATQFEVIGHGKARHIVAASSKLQPKAEPKGRGYWARPSKGQAIPTDRDTTLSPVANPGTSGGRYSVRGSGFWDTPRDAKGKPVKHAAVTVTDPASRAQAFGGLARAMARSQVQVGGQVTGKPMGKPAKADGRARQAAAILAAEGRVTPANEARKQAAYREKAAEAKMGAAEPGQSARDRDIPIIF